MADEALTSMRLRIANAGLTGEDLTWLDRLGWKPDAVPPIGSEAEKDAYERRNAAIAASIEHLTFAEKAASPEAMLAATIGARLADWRERGGDDEDE